MKTTTRLPKTLLAAVAVTAAALTSGPASAAPLFTVDEGVIPGAQAKLVTADRLSFTYQAKIIQTIGGSSLAGSDDPFVENGFLNKASFANGGSAVPSQLNSSLTPFGYGIYGVFKITGEADPGANPGEIHAIFQTATLTLYTDPNQDNTYGFDGSNNVVVGNSGEDQALATLSLITGEAFVRASLAKGDFNSFLNFALTPYGQTFFVNPNPFFGIENFGGDTLTISGASLTTSFVADATGAGAELFLAVPEPATLSIVGLALLGMGAVTRRQKKKNS